MTIGSLERLPGTSSVLLVAPHGGRREPRRKRRKTNDLHTASLTRELAEATRSPAIVNAATDRNVVDLNRLSEVRRHAPEFLAAIREEVDGAVSRAGHATVLFIHGWNAIQPACDVGIGAKLGESGLLPVSEAIPSVPESYLPTLRAFERRARNWGIRVSFGERYPAAGRENIVQALTTRHADDPNPDVRALAALAEAGRLAAVQLELAIPLRWPGWRRDGFAEMLEPFFSVGSDAVEPPSLPHPPAPAARHTLELHDEAAGIGVFAAAEQTSDGRRSARLLVCLGGREIALFTGEQASGDSLVCAGFRWLDREGGTAEVSFYGPMLRFPRSDPFLDLEEGLASARLCEAEATLEFEPGAIEEAPFRSGRIRGNLSIDGGRFPIDALAAVGPAAFPKTPPGWIERRRLHVPIGDDVLSLASGRNGSEEIVHGERLRDGRPERLLSARTLVHPGSDGMTPEAWRIEVVTRSGPLRAFGEVTHVVPVVRPAPGGSERAWFGLARFRGEGMRGAGTFELSRRDGERKTSDVDS